MQAGPLPAQAPTSPCSSAASWSANSSLDDMVPEDDVRSKRMSPEWQRASGAQSPRGALAHPASSPLTWARARFHPALSNRSGPRLVHLVAPHTWGGRQLGERANGKGEPEPILVPHGHSPRDSLGWDPSPDLGSSRALLVTSAPAASPTLKLLFRARATGDLVGGERKGCDGLEGRRALRDS